MINNQLLLPYLGAGVTVFATSIGALPAFAASRLSERVRNTAMGFSAGIMLSACSFSLILPAIHLAQERITHKLLAATLVGLAILAGSLFIHACNQLIPHEHFFSGREGGPSQIHLKRIWLFVLAITLHNFPEGLAVGTGVGSQSFEIAMPILAGIGLQDLPEGFVVAMALISAKYTPSQAIGVAVVTGLVEGVAAIIGYVAMVQMNSILPWALALSGGAMLYVVIHEIIPEIHSKNHVKNATAGLMFGFVLMMVLDVALT